MRYDGLTGLLWRGEEVKTYREAHAVVCKHEGCRTLLSAYNPDCYCALHEPLHRRKEVELYKLCPACGGVYHRNRFAGSSDLCCHCRKGAGCTPLTTSS